MSKCPVGWAIPADSFNSLDVMEFVSKETIMLFGPPQYILSENDLKFDCKVVQYLEYRLNIQWKCKSKYNPQSNGIVEIMVYTSKEALQKVTQSEYKV